MKGLTAEQIEEIRAEILSDCELVGDCWIYRSSINNDGYGTKRINGRFRNVHRIMLAFKDGVGIDSRFDACHDTRQCPYKACCNPAHLFWASRKDNCKRREQDDRDVRGVFSYWEDHAWLNGMFVTGRRDPGIDHCIAFLNRGKIKKQVQTLTAEMAQTLTGVIPLSAFIRGDMNGGIVEA